jgi:hypothetical protein
MTDSPTKKSKFLPWVAFFFLGLVGTHCASPPPRPPLENDARLIAPLPACLIPLQSKGPASKGLTLSLQEHQYWKLIFPDFDITNRLLPQDPKTCTGRAILNVKEFQRGDIRGGWPFHAIEGDVLISGGPDRMKLAWLRTHEFPDGTQAGALGVVRVKEDTAEVYAVGTYRGHPTSSRFGFERVGSEVVVVAIDDGCKNNVHNRPCATIQTVYAPRQGTLEPIAFFPIEKIAYGVRSERGVRGLVRYHLTAAPRYVSGAIMLQEQISVRDDQEREIAKAELERRFIYLDNNRMMVDQDSIWFRIYPSDKRLQKENAHLHPADV